MSIGFLLIIIIVIAIIVYGIKNKKLEEILEFGIGIIGTIGGFIWRLTIANAKDGTMFKWAENSGLPRWDYSVYAKSYHDYFNARANVLIAVGVVALVIGFYRLKKKNTSSDNPSKNNKIENTKNKNNDDNIKKIEELKKLADTGVITTGEFEKKKKDLLDKI